MHPNVYRLFEDIFSKRTVTGSVLEIGAVPSKATLLGMQSLSGAREKIGINLDGPYDYEGISILKGNGNSMKCFESNKFDAVICNATLEHDKYFWKTLDEIRRVSKSGAIIAIGIPGYLHLPGSVSYTDKAAEINIENIEDATLTFRVHNAPGDYYRFSPQALTDVFL